MKELIKKEKIAKVIAERIKGEFSFIYLYKNLIGILKITVNGCVNCHNLFRGQFSNMYQSLKMNTFFVLEISCIKTYPLT